MRSRLEIVYLPNPDQWVAVSHEEPRVVAQANSYRQLADELNAQRIDERALVVAPAA